MYASNKNKCVIKYENLFRLNVQSRLAGFLRNKISCLMCKCTFVDLPGSTTHSVLPGLLHLENILNYWVPYSLFLNLSLKKAYILYPYLTCRNCNVYYVVNILYLNLTLFFLEIRWAHRSSAGKRTVQPLSGRRSVCEIRTLMHTNVWHIWFYQENKYIFKHLHPGLQWQILVILQKPDYIFPWKSQTKYQHNLNVTFNE